MKLISLSDYIDEMESNVSYYDISVEKAYHDIVRYKYFLGVSAARDMFMGDKSIFTIQMIDRYKDAVSSKFIDSSCWDAGYDNYCSGDFLKIETTFSNGHTTDHNIFNLYNMYIGDIIDIFKHEKLELNDDGIKRFFGLDELRDHKLNKIL